MDIRMPVVDGIAATRVLTAPGGPAGPGVDPDHVRVGRGHREGAAGRGQRVPAQGRHPGRVGARGPGGRRGEALLAPRVTKRLLDLHARHLPPARRASSVLAALTPREDTILRLVAGGSRTSRSAGPWPGGEQREKPCRAPAGQTGGARPGAPGDLRLRARPDLAATSPVTAAGEYTPLTDEPCGPGRVMQGTVTGVPPYAPGQRPGSGARGSPRWCDMAAPEDSSGRWPPREQANPHLRRNPWKKLYGSFQVSMVPPEAGIAGFEWLHLRFTGQLVGFEWAPPWMVGAGNPGDHADDNVRHE